MDNYNGNHGVEADEVYQKRIVYLWVAIPNQP